MRGPPTNRYGGSTRSRVGADLTAAAGLALSALAVVAVVRKLIERTAVRELALSRARIQAAADDERRRIERDLHDGVQQRLVSLCVRLALATDLMRDDLPSGPRLVEELGAEAEQALEEVRVLAHGIYPAELVEFGLEVALKDLGSRQPIHTTVAAGGIGRFTPEIEAAVYFCCLEAVQNTHGADTIAISIEAGRNLRFEVSDNGSGFSAHSLGMRDRLGAVGGELDVRAVPGGGTRVVGTISLQLKEAVLEPVGRVHAAG